MTNSQHVNMLAAVLMAGVGGQDPEADPSRLVARWSDLRAALELEVEAQSLKRRMKARQDRESRQAAMLEP